MLHLSPSWDLNLSPHQSPAAVSPLARANTYFHPHPSYLRALMTWPRHTPAKIMPFPCKAPYPNTVGMHLCSLPASTSAGTLGFDREHKKPFMPQSQIPIRAPAPQHRVCWRGKKTAPTGALQCLCSGKQQDKYSLCCITQPSPQLRNTLKSQGRKVPLCLALL